MKKTKNLNREHCEACDESSKRAVGFWDSWTFLHLIHKSGCIYACTRTDCPIYQEKFKSIRKKGGLHS